MLLYSLTIFTGCTDDMRIMREEIFGPLARLLSFATAAGARSATHQERACRARLCQAVAPPPVSS